MIPHYYHQIGQICQAELLQEAKANQQFDRRIQHFIRPLGKGPLAMINYVFIKLHAVRKTVQRRTAKASVAEHEHLASRRDTDRSFV